MAAVDKTKGSPMSVSPTGAADRARSRTVQRLCVWAGPVFIVTMAIGYVAIARMIPPPAPGDSVTETASFFLDHPNRMKLGMIVSAAAAGLLVPLSTVIALQMRRIEGEYPALSMIQFACGVLLSLEFIYLIFFWQAAVFRLDRSPELVQLLNDMAWIPYIGLSVTVCMQAAAIGFATLIDSRTDRVFPRWFGYFQIWAAVFFLPGTFNVFFHDGPLAWNGLVAFYLPIGVYVAWNVITPIVLFAALRQQAVEEDAAGDGPNLQQLAADVERLQAQIVSARSAGSVRSSETL